MVEPGVPISYIDKVKMWEKREQFIEILVHKDH